VLVGSQISMWIAGDTTIETSQNGGRPLIAGDPSGGLNIPALKSFAVIGVTSGNFRYCKLVQLSADAVDAQATVPNSRRA
jgi:hypothetical protein